MAWWFTKASHNLLESLDDALAFSAAQVAATLEIENGEINPPEGFDKAGPICSTMKPQSESSRRMASSAPGWTEVAFQSLTDNLKGPTFTSFMNPATNERVRTYILPVEAMAARLG